MEDNNNDQLVTAPTMEVLSVDQEAKELTVAPTTQELSQEQLAKVLESLKSAQPTNFKHRFQGRAGTAKAKVAKHWYNGELISQTDFDKLSWEEIHASNNVIRKG